MNVYMDEKCIAVHSHMIANVVCINWTDDLQSKVTFKIDQDIEFFIDQSFILNLSNYQLISSW